MAGASLVDAVSQPEALAHILASLDSRGVANLRLEISSFRVSCFRRHPENSEEVHA